MPRLIVEVIKRCKIWLSRRHCGQGFLKGWVLSWFIEKFERFLAAAWIAAFGLAASQVTPFATQYMARTATDLSRAEARLADVQVGLRFQTMAETVRQELATEATQNRSKAQATHDAVAKTTPLLYPFALWRSAQPDIRSATWEAFVPALPVSTWAILFTLMSALIGFGIYELIKWPIVMVLQAPRRRFRKRGGLI